MSYAAYNINPKCVHAHQKCTAKANNNNKYLFLTQKKKMNISGETSERI